MAKPRRRATTKQGRRAGAPAFPLQAERAFARALVSIADRANVRVRAILLPLAKEIGLEDPDERKDATDEQKANAASKSKGVASKVEKVYASEYSPTKVKAEADRAVRQIVANSKGQFKKLGIKPRKEPDLAKLARGWAKEISDSTADLGKRQSKKLEMLLREGGGRYASSLADDIEEQLGVTRNRAEFIARNSAGTLNSKITRHRMHAAGVRLYIWTTMEDSLVREAHADLDGEEFEVEGDGDPEEGHPGEPPNCFPGDTPLAGDHAILRAYRHGYRGKTTKLVTHSGETLECTPNHPVLTASGWKPAKDVDIGDHVFEVPLKRGRFAEQDAKDGYPTLAQVFDALRLVGTTRPVTGGAGQFHGDGTADQNVDVVDADGRLEDGIEAGLDERLLKALLAVPHVKPQGVTRQGALLLGLKAIGLPATGEVCGLSYCMALHERRVSKADDVRLTTTTRFDPATLQEVRNGLSANAILLGDRFDRGTLSVDAQRLFLREAFRVLRRTVVTKRLDAPSSELLGEMIGRAAHHERDLRDEHPVFEHPLRIVEKAVGEHSGAVYNLETEAGWYAVGQGHGPIVSNCRCVQYPLKPDKGDEGDDEDAGDSGDDEDESDDEDEG